MGWGEWMATSHSLERQATIEIHRREVRTMPEPELRALADHLVVQAHQQAVILRNAMRRIAELEVKGALLDAAAAARSLQAGQRKLGAIAHLRRWCRWLLGGSSSQQQPELIQRPTYQRPGQLD